MLDAICKAMWSDYYTKYMFDLNTGFKMEKRDDNENMNLQQEYKFAM
jgi:hypothetical protein